MRSGLAAGEQWLGELAGRLFPPSCTLCGSCVPTERPPVCDPCWSRLPRAVPPRCSRCGAPGPRFVDGVEACGECIDWPPGLRRVRAPFLMREGAAELVRSLKYRGWTALAEPMGTAMAPAARALEVGGRYGSGPLLLVPVPLSPARRRRRGFNQAGLLAHGLGRELGWRVDGVLRRQARGRRQARLGGASRRENVRGLFRARRPPPGGTGGGDGGVGPAALVVDDVVTTGSTAAACAEALRRAGWRPLGAVAFARAVAGRPTGSREAAALRPTSRDG